uniref:CBS domain-containing protein n=1 Tax=Arcella intermedia TaxID=1963864 RepID=A0A6B2LB44_9EUKA
MKVKDVPIKPRIHTIPETSNFAAALKILVDNKILSAPVVNSEGLVTGQLDLVDLIVFIVHLSKRAQEIFVSLGLLSEDKTINFSDLHVDKQLQDLFDAYDDSTSIANFSKRNSIVTVSLEQSLADLFESLVTYHRVVVLDPSTKALQNYITQSDLIKLLYKNKDLIGDLGRRTVGDLALGSTPVVSVRENQQVLEAFKLVAIKNVSSIAVVNSNGTLTGEIGPRDMRNMNPDELIDQILVLCKELVSKTLPPITVKATDSLLSVIERLETEARHRVWVVDDNNKLQAVISIGDVLRVLIK